MEHERTKKQKNDKRQVLAEVLPLEQPYAINFNISNVCNFRCFYCFQSENAKQVSKINKKLMDFSVFKRCIDNMENIHLKNINLCGYGEPLLHRDFCQMVKYIKGKQITDCVETITNGSLLSKEYCDRLIESGLDRIRISLQGISSADYKNTSDVNLDFDSFYENIQYLCEQKRDLFVYIKIMDVMVKEREKIERFQSLFENLADQIFIESLMPLSDLDYSKADSDFSKTLYGEKIKTKSVCTQPFYSCTVDWDGTVIPCCMIPIPERFGNLSEMTLNEIWNGTEYTAFLISLLDGKAYKDNEACKSCNRYKYVALEKDSLESKKSELLNIYQEKYNRNMLY